MGLLSIVNSIACPVQGLLRVAQRDCTAQAS